MKKIKILGLIMSIIASVMCVIFYDWKLLIIIFLFAYSNNINNYENKN